MKNEKNERESKTGTEAAEGKSRNDTMAVEVYLKMDTKEKLFVEILLFR